MKALLVFLTICSTSSVYAGRLYSAEHGRWLNRDPIGVEGGINLYNSVSNNMVNGFGGRVGFVMGNAGSQMTYKIRRWSGVDAYGHEESDETPGWDKALVKYKDSDEHGRAIVLQWVLGWGQAWHIPESNKTWGTYMVKHQSISTQVASKLRAAAKGIFGKKRKLGKLDASYGVKIDDTENLHGYDLLHGTNKFMDTWGPYKVEKAKGCTKISFNLKHTWNDVIDPNPKYATDMSKAAWVKKQAVNLMGKKPYDYVMTITWSAKATVTLDNNGKIIEESGWPFINAFDDGVFYNRQEDTSGTGIINTDASKTGTKVKGRRGN
jgi:hypothetical protein